MSFTSSLSVRTRTVLVYVVEIFFFHSTSMENILQSIVKIIIIGCFCERTGVHCNRQFLPPPIPYFQNDDYFLPGFAPPYREEIVPVYYREQNFPSPVPYQNVNSYARPQLFHQNENYDPLRFENPGIKYPIPQIFPHKPNYHQSYKPTQINYKEPSVLPGISQDRPAGDASRKKSAVFATNIIVKEENQPPYYHDDYNKNYHYDDYSDNYSDDISAQAEPCTPNSPYRYFESPKTDRNAPNADNKYSLCNPYFQPNFGNGGYTVKMPITLLPSRFPPRVEQLVERIQNYFSTYTQEGTSKPENHTSSTTVQPPIEASSESETQPPVTTGLDKKNITGENQEVNAEQTNAEQSEVTTAGELNNLERITQKTIVVEIETDEEEMSTTDARIQKESQMAVQTTQNPGEQTESVFNTTEEAAIKSQELQTNKIIKNEQNIKAEVSQQVESDSSSENRSVIDKAENSQEGTSLPKVTGLSNTTGAAEEMNKTEESGTVRSTLQYEVTDNNG